MKAALPWNVAWQEGGSERRGTARGDHGVGFNAENAGLISQKVFKKSFCKSQFPQIRQLILYYYYIKNKLTDLCGN